jgi:hypothetical protein
MMSVRCGAWRTMALISSPWPHPSAADEPRQFDHRLVEDGGGAGIPLLPLEPIEALPLHTLPYVHGLCRYDEGSTCNRRRC